MHTQNTPVSSTGHLLETIQEPKQESFPRGQDQLAQTLGPLLKAFTQGKSEASQEEIQRQIQLISQKYGTDVAEEQLRQGIAKGWKSIPISQYEKYNPDAVSAESNAAQDLERRRQSMIQQCLAYGLKSAVWDSHREEYISVYYELVEAGKIDEEELKAS